MKFNAIQNWRGLWQQVGCLITIKVAAYVPMYVCMYIWMDTLICTYACLFIAKYALSGIHFSLVYLIYFNTYRHMYISMYTHTFDPFYEIIIVFSFKQKTRCCLFVVSLANFLQLYCDHFVFLIVVATCCILWKLLTFFCYKHCLWHFLEFFLINFLYYCCCCYFTICGLSSLWNSPLRCLASVFHSLTLLLVIFWIWIVFAKIVQQLCRHCVLGSWVWHCVKWINME